MTKFEFGWQFLMRAVVIPLAGMRTLENVGSHPSVRERRARGMTLGPYNAVNGSSYDNPDDMQIATMDDVVCMGMKNDVSFLVSDMPNPFG